MITKGFFTDQERLEHRLAYDAELIRRYKEQLPLSKSDRSEARRLIRMQTFNNIAELYYELQLAKEFKDVLAEKLIRNLMNTTYGKLGAAIPPRKEAK